MTRELHSVWHKTNNTNITNQKLTNCTTLDKCLQQVLCQWPIVTALLGQVSVENCCSVIVKVMRSSYHIATGTKCRRVYSLTIYETRKHRQSYRHADPRQQWSQVAQGYTIPAMVTSNLVVFITVWPWPFDLWVNACQVTAIEYMCTKFGVDSSSRFPFKVQTISQTDKQTDATERPTHAGSNAGMGNDN